MYATAKQQHLFNAVIRPFILSIDTNTNQLANLKSKKYMLIQKLIVNR